jgi:hypothetical protein
MNEGNRGFGLKELDQTVTPSVPSGGNRGCVFTSLLVVEMEGRIVF